MQAKDNLDAIVVGAGFAGLYSLFRLLQLGFSAKIIEAASGVGGTWFWNRYPGARCDIESLEYSYQFSEALQRDWCWQERYASQAEILCYLNHVADRFDLRGDIQLNTRVESAFFDERTGRWRVRCTDGSLASARFLVMATGCLSVPNFPDIPGGADFAGPTYHTGQWPHEGVDFSGSRVGIIGTGSSAIQSIPPIAAQAQHLTVFQRTPSYTVPARNGPLDSAAEARIKADYPGFRARNAMMPFAAFADVGVGRQSALALSSEEREQVYQSWWSKGGLPFLAAFADLMVSREANDTAAEFLRSKIRATVDDAETAEALMPHHILGCKRLCADSNFYATFNRDNVSLVDLKRQPIRRATVRGIQAGDTEYPLDALVYATGFDAMTGALMNIDVRGRAGLKLGEKWRDGPRNYLGLSAAGFPNLFMITGPGSPSVLANMVPAIEQHVDWLGACLAHLKAQGLKVIEATEEAEAQWITHTNEVAHSTLWPQGDSWYIGANIPGKPRIFMPYIGFPNYVATCGRVAAAGYEGFSLS